MHQVGVLSEAVDYVLSDQMREKYALDVMFVTVGMIASITVALVLAACMAAQQIVAAASVPTIRLQETKAQPALPLAQGHRWHLFLSHIWGTGQDQCATIKRQMRLLLPSVSIFLDVDVRICSLCL